MTDTTAYEATVGWGNRLHAVLLDHHPTAEDPPYTTVCGKPATAVYHARFIASHMLLKTCRRCERLVAQRSQEA